jgi:polysaccharide export outer membrane protein
MRIQRPIHAVSKAIKTAMLHRGWVAVATAALLASSALGWGQTKRPAIVPLDQGGGAPATGMESAAGNIGGMTDTPISAGEVVHINVFDAPDFSIITRVSESGDIVYPMLGVVHLSGLSSVTAADLLSKGLKTHQLMQNPAVTVTVDSTSTGITVLGEVRAPGIYPLPGKHLLSDVLAAAGGLTANTGRVIEISNNRTPDKTTYIPWDPTMHNTGNFDRPVHPGDRVLVRACGLAYVGGNVGKPGAYSLCGSEKMTLSEVLTLAGGVTSFTAARHTLLIRPEPNGSRVVQQVDIKKVQRAEEADPIVHEDDIIYVSPSPMKAALDRGLGFAMSLAGPLLYVYH